MSIVAEFARELDGKFPPQSRGKVPSLDYQGKSGGIFDVRAVIFDVYGTLIDYWNPRFCEPSGREHVAFEAFENVIRYFGFSGFLMKMSAEQAPAKTLSDLYHGLIALDHEKSKRKGITCPEIRVERIWKIILMMLARHGFTYDREQFGSEDDAARCVACFYHFHALGRGFFPGVADMLAALRESHIRLGILSNAQFYTPIDLTLFLRRQSNGRYDDFREIFDENLVFFSFEYGMAKPGEYLYRRLYDALYEYHILPSQTVFVGNDLVVDIQNAGNLGMKTAFYTGCAASAFTHGQEETIVPDISFGDFSLLPRMLSFHEEGAHRT